jgi:hypothetical protein
MRRFLEADEAFRLEVADAQQDSRELILESLFQSGLSGSVPAAWRWLQLTSEPVASGRAAMNSDPEHDPLADLGDVVPLDPKRRRNIADSSG